ncbi:hypothetical protein ACGFIF_41690, partial [Kribbella sp. NPDC049174]|uniref:hypothetical protein n=1 Tax=Kribbella sp. NPDC049174 TaxID=3364112 RepID=UPI00371BF340
LGIVLAGHGPDHLASPADGWNQRVQEPGSRPILAADEATHHPAVPGQRQMPTPTTPTPDGPSGDDPVRRLHVDYVKHYTTFAELRADSAAIVKVIAGEQILGEIARLPTTVTSATVTKVLWGEAASGAAIEIRQLGTAEMVGNMSKVLEPGAEYLVFLIPSTGADDAAPNRYLIAGDVGVYQLQGDQYVLRGGNMPPKGANSLPPTLQATSAEAIITS